MSESGLSVKYADLLKSVSMFVGYGSDVSKLANAKVDEIDSYIQAGLRQFYYPPGVKGIEAGYEWSFLQPTTTIDTVADDADQDLPDGLSRVHGGFYFEPQESVASIVVVSQGRILQLRQHDTDSSVPRYAAIRPKEQTAGAGQGMEVQWWPTPNDAYTLTYRYEAYQGKLTDDNIYPLGGMKYSELLTESCIAIAEQRANDEAGLHTETFYRLLAAGIELDRKTGAQSFGPMGMSSEIPETLPRRNIGTSYDITYDGSTL